MISDILIFLIVCGFAYAGYKNGYKSGILMLVKLIISIFLAILFYIPLANVLVVYVNSPVGFSDLVGFFILFFGCYVLIDYLGNLMLSDVITGQIAHTRRLVGAVVGVVNGLLVSCILLMCLFNMMYVPLLSTTIPGGFLSARLLKGATDFENIFHPLSSDAIARSLAYRLLPNEETTIKDLGFSIMDPKVDKNAEKELYKLLNQDRKRYTFQDLLNLPPLELDENLTAAARAHATDMLQKGYFDHYSKDKKSPDERAIEHGAVFSRYGENIVLAKSSQQRIGKNRVIISGAEMAHLAFMNSPGHRMNILSWSYDRVGIGCMEAGDYGVMCVEEFSG